MCRRCRSPPIVPRIPRISRIRVAANRLSHARDRSITDKLRFTYVRYADAQHGRSSSMWFIAHARAHREPRVDTVTNVTIRGLRGARGEPAPERDVTCVVCGGGQVRVITTASRSRRGLRSLHPDDNRSGTERSGFAHCAVIAARARRGNLRGQLSSTPPLTISPPTRGIVHHL